MHYILSESHSYGQQKQPHQSASQFQWQTSRSNTIHSTQKLGTRRLWPKKSLLLMWEKILTIHMIESMSLFLLTFIWDSFTLSFRVIARLYVSDRAAPAWLGWRPEDSNEAKKLYYDHKTVYYTPRCLTLSSVGVFWYNRHPCLTLDHCQRSFQSLSNHWFCAQAIKTICFHPAAFDAV